MAAPGRRLRRLARAVAARRRVLVLLDFDGTLCEIRLRPSQARLSRARRGLLARLAAGAGLFWLLILFSLTFADFLTRY